MIDARDFFLGGYGFGSGRVGNVVEVPAASDALGNRYATGILGDRSFNRFPSDDGTFESDGAHTRAFAVSDAGNGTDGPVAHTIVLAQIETQGYFDAYKQGPFGINEIRKDASARIADLAGHDHKPAPVPSPSEIVVDSDHSHGGADTAGVWGGVPTSYLQLVHDRTVDAIVSAWSSMRKGTLRYGVAKAGVDGEGDVYPPEEGNDGDYLLTNQFRYDPNNKAMDDEVRVLQAVDDEDDIIATYVNFSAHPTVLGSSNTSVTGDYVGRLDVAIEKEFGGFGMDQVGTLGRTQPARDGCPDSTGMTQDQASLCALDNYAGRVLRKVKMAVDSARPMTTQQV